MNNLQIYITAEYEDKYGGSGNWEEKVSGYLWNSDAVIDQAIEALGRMGKHISEFSDKEPSSPLDEE